MDEEFLETPTPSSDRALEQAIVALKKGAHLLKYGRRGKPKFCPFRLSTDEKFLIWYSGQEEKQLRLSLDTKLIRGQKTVNFQRQLQPEKESQSFSLVYRNGERTLDLICKDRAEADCWFVGLRAVISRCHHPKALGALRIRRGAQSCVNSPAGFTRRKRNLGLAEEPSKNMQVHSVCGSPTQSLSERCFSGGLTYSSNSFCLESSLSTMQKDVLIPNYAYIEQDDLKRRGAVYGSTEIQTNMLTSAHRSPQTDNNVLRDVLIWGEGIEGGCLGGGVDKFANHSRLELDALYPKLLKSTVKLDAQKISLGARHAAIITKQGEVFCWGEGKGGRLGHKADMDVPCPKIVDSLSGVYVTSVACGEYQTCAVTLSGELYTWGDNCYGSELISGHRKSNQWIPHKLYGPLDCISISMVACGEWHMAIVSTNGQLFTYGDGTFGVLGHGNTRSISQPKEVESLKDLRVKSVACGPWHTAAVVDVMVECSSVDDEGPPWKLFTWGDGDKGRLGHGNQERKLLPTCVAQLVDRSFVQVSCGRMLTVGRTYKGIVYTMGSAVHGQLGNPQAKDRSITAVEGKLKGESVKEISSGSYHVAVLTEHGRVYTWGKGGNGQLGLGYNVDRDSPTLVKALRDREVESITCGSNSTAAICLHKSISSIDQAACRGCSMSFGFTRKKHSCYNCGLSFCHACSSNKAANASLGPNKCKPFRVCDPCFNQLQRIPHSVRMSNLESRSPRLLSTTYKVLTDMREDLGDANSKESQMLSMGWPRVEDKQCWEGKTMKNQRENQQPLDPNLSLLHVLPRWGQVPCPESFKSDCRECSVAHVLKNQISSLPPVCVQESPGSNFTSTPLNVEEDIIESNKMLTEEVQKLRAEVATLEKLCKTRGEKIQDCHQRIEETWSLAKEEAAKCKAAKDVITALTLKLHTMSKNISTAREVNGRLNTSLPEITSLHNESTAVKGVNCVFVPPDTPPEVGLPEYRKFGSLCSTPVMFSDKLKPMRDGDTTRAESTSADESSGRRTEEEKNGTKASNVEWVERYEPGVYLTCTTSLTGHKVLKRVRFSRNKFTIKEAERWWEENQVELSEKYDIEGYQS